MHTVSEQICKTNEKQHVSSFYKNKVDIMQFEETENLCCSKKFQATSHVIILP